MFAKRREPLTEVPSEKPRKSLSSGSQPVLTFPIGVHDRTMIVNPKILGGFRECLVLGIIGKGNRREAELAGMVATKTRKDEDEHDWLRRVIDSG